MLEGPAPHFVTFQIGSHKLDDLQKGGAPAPVRAVAAETGAVRQQPEAPFREAKQAVDLTAAARIVSVGRGIKAPENIDLARQLADAMQAELAASRPICDAGWVPFERQVGSSGQTVAPKMYLALGISGAIQHVVGMKGARTIVAINKDAEAPDLRGGRLRDRRRHLRGRAGADRRAEVVTARPIEAALASSGRRPASASRRAPATLSSGVCDLRRRPERAGSSAARTVRPPVVRVPPVPRRRSRSCP